MSSTCIWLVSRYHLYERLTSESLFTMVVSFCSAISEERSCGGSDTSGMAAAAAAANALGSFAREHAEMCRGEGASQGVALVGSGP